MPTIEHPPTELTLYTCHIDRRRSPIPFLSHPCRIAHHALEEAGIHYTTVVLGLGRPRGILTKGRRPELKRISGQEKLPVLALPDGTTVNGSSAIATWARRQQGLSSV